jgi:hypothetical protein
MGEIREKVEEGRRLRRELEAQILPVATSLDGRVFRFEAALGLDLQPGGYVTLEVDGRDVLGQIVEVRVVRREGPQVDGAVTEMNTAFRATISVSYAEGGGLVLEDAPPFHDASLQPAAPDRLGRYLATARPGRAVLPVGDALMAPGATIEFDAGGFGRHTFLCGQSGCGKSYALGAVLERLLLETDLRIVVLDPNSDFARMGRVRGGVTGRAAARWRAVAKGIRVRSAHARGTDRLRLRFFDLPPRLQAAVAGLDPLGDRDEYGALLDLVEREAQGLPLEELLGFSTDESDALRRLGQRVRNIGLSEWDVWSRRREDSGLLGDLTERDWRCLVVDLGSIPRVAERELVAATVLTRLWEDRTAREPLLIVVDEAHNVCPQHPATPLTAIATEMAINIAAEGRKYGLYTLVATQRPQKVHENVLSQCDNLMLMRMTSAADLERIAEIFSFVPSNLTGRASVLRPGEMLAAGRITSHPVFLRVGARVSDEGGADVPADWAAPRAG